MKKLTVAQKATLLEDQFFATLRDGGVWLEMTETFWVNWLGEDAQDAAAILNKMYPDGAGADCSCEEYSY